jgi:hypothetical protein
MTKGNVMQPPAGLTHGERESKIGFECPQAANSRAFFLALHRGS